MRYLGIDYGERKVGIAIAYGPLADPYKVLQFRSEADLLKTLKTIVENERIDVIVVGISEREIAEASSEFAEKIRKHIGKPVELADETLTTHDAHEKAIESGMRRSKRRAMEDALSAAIMLQSYLDIL